MGQPFEVIEKGYIPTWRRARKGQDPLWVRVPLAICSLISIVLLLWPTAEGYKIPLSLEWANHETMGYARLVGMETTLAVLAAKLWRKRCFFDAISCLMPMLALQYLASSSPYSFDHLGMFATLAFSTVLWHWMLAARMEDPKLFYMAAAATASGLVCCSQLGVGERALGICSIVTANVAFYEHVLPYTD